MAHLIYISSKVTFKVELEDLQDCFKVELVELVKRT